MTFCFFASDLHGSIERYEKLFRAIEAETPVAVFLGGDLLPAAFMPPSTYQSDHDDFVNDFLAARLAELRQRLGDRYPEIFVILGNDDGRFEEAAFLDLTARGIWRYAHENAFALGEHRVYGYAYVPPTPFQLKDWERYDVSRYVDPGCVPPDQGVRTIPVADREIRYATIREDLDQLVDAEDLSRAVFLFHTPPYQTKLDRADLDGKSVDHAPLDVHVGSIAVQRFIQARQPLLTLHGHVHESTRLTGSWRDRIGRTHMFNAAHDGEELALIRFDLGDLEHATRELI